MPIAIWKSIFWFALAFGIGFLLIFGVVSITEGAQKDWIVYGAAILSFIISVGAVFGLRQCYWLQPMRKIGHWHLTLADCFGAMFFTAFCMLIWRSKWPDSFLFWGAGVSLAAGLWFLGSLMLAAREGCTNPKIRLAFGLALAFRNYGVLATCAFLSVVILISLTVGIHHAVEKTADVLGGSVVDGNWFNFSVRLGLASFAIGWFAVPYFRARIDRTSEITPTN